jgi:CMP/dCMP kinase
LNQSANNKIIIAVDGFSSSGKSTLARQLAKALGYIFVDTGAMYRAVTLYFLSNDIRLDDPSQVKKALQNIHIRFENIDGKNTCFLNNVNVETDIRTMMVSAAVSDVSANSAVRRFLVVQQREMGSNKGLVMDGRDIGTVVFPDAEVKFFITAERNVRADRRYKEFLSKRKPVTRDEILKNISDRDQTDTQRSDSPLRKADDAIEIDNTNLNPEEQFDYAMKIIRQIIENKE